MIRILLDTNILHQEGLTSTRFQILQRLIKSGFVNLIIPEIVIEEYKSKRVDQANEDFKKIQSAVDNLHRKTIIDKDCFDVRQFSNFVASSINETNRRVESWLDENQVTLVPISDTSIDDLFKSYFTGTGAFRNKKQREDIPDAVIYDCIMRLAVNSELLVVAKDGVLIESIKNIDNVRVYKELSEVLDIPNLKEELAELNTNEMKVNSIIQTLATSSCSYDVAEYLTSNHMVEVDGFYDGDFVELPFEISHIETHSHEVHVHNVIELFVDSPSYLGNGKFSYSLVVQCEAALSFYCEEDAYESLSYEYRKELSTSARGSQSDVLVNGVVNVTLRGVVVLNGIDTNVDSRQLEVHLSYLGAERSEVECSVNLEKLIVDDIF
ncbi:PIN domain-containing protein [Photobacterium swingsii]|uniref:PIN domain-containing protein n=1 Tax=Photobacterium swingsii TaxID=680026 RepID=UPI00352D25E7